QEPPVVERARERVVNALTSGTTGDPHRNTRVELLSYPVARVLVSLVDEGAMASLYARAEAADGANRLRSDVEDSTELRSTDDNRMTIDRLLREFDLTGATIETVDGHRLTVAAYLDLAADRDGDEWRLVGRSLNEGWVPIDSDELLTLLETAIEARVAEGLPLPVPEAIADPLEDDVAAIKAELDDHQFAHSFDEAIPERFPPCIRTLVDRIRDGTAVPDHTTFAVVGFLAAAGMQPAEIVAHFGPDAGIDDRTVKRVAERLVDEDSCVQYPPPSCATMQAYGDCVNRDELCDDVGHPLEYYEARLSGQNE
ncbi:MAG: DNA primase large subunit, partial [Halobacteriales archaeon]